jgi:hypothetical protein
VLWAIIAGLCPLHVCSFVEILSDGHGADVVGVMGEVPMAPPLVGFTRLHVLVMRAGWTDFRISDVDVLPRRTSTLVHTW